MKKRVWKLVIAFAFMMLFCLQTTEAKAADLGTIELNGQITAGTIPVGEVSSYHTFTLQTDGWVILEGSNFDNFWNACEVLKIKDLSDVVLVEYDGYDTKSGKIPLEAGNYKIEMSGSYEDYDKEKEQTYNLKLSFQASGATDSSNNNTFDTADALEADKKMNGFFSRQDREDYFKFTIGSAQTVTFTVTNSMKKNIQYEIYDSGNAKLATKSADGTSDVAKTSEYSQELAAGTYYVKVFVDTRYLSDLGSYSISYSSKKLVKLVKSITITGVQSTYTNETVQYTAELDPADADNKTLVWTTSDPEIATVDATGKVTTLKAGTVNIKAQAMDEGKVYGEITLVVNARLVESIQVNGPKTTVVNKSVSYTAQVNPANADNSTIEWSTSDSEIATIDSTGKVRALKAGKVKIIARATDESGYTKEVELLVKPSTPKVPSLTTKKSKLNITISGVEQVEGYEIQYSLKKNMKKPKTVAVKAENKDTISKSVKLEKGKKYFVRIRAYITIDGKKQYGLWSKKVNKKVK